MKKTSLTLQDLAAPLLSGLNRFGEMALFLLDAFRQSFFTHRLPGKVVRQIYTIGAQSMFVILLIGIFHLAWSLAFRHFTPCPCSGLKGCSAPCSR